MEKALSNNIKKIYLMVFCRSAMLIAAVFVPLLQSQGLTMAQVMQTQALFALTVALAEVPSGYLADTWGRKNTLMLGAALCSIGFALLLRADSFVDFLLYEFLLGLGMSLNSGADLAILYDTQSYLNRNKQHPVDKKLIARLFTLDGIASAAAAICAGLLSLWSLQWIVIAQALVGLLPLLCSITLVEPPRKISIHSHRENFSLIKHAVFKERLVLMTAIAMIVFGLAAIYIFWLYQKYWELQGVPLTYFGYLWATHCIVRGISAHYAHDVESRLGPQKALLLIAALSIFGLTAMSFSNGWIGVLVAFILPVSRGLSSVIFTDALNKRLNPEFRATVNSLVSLGFRVMFILTAPALGLLVDGYGVKTSLLALACLFAPAYLWVLLALFGAIRQTEATANKEVSIASH